MNSKKKQRKRSSAKKARKGADRPSPPKKPKRVAEPSSTLPKFVLPLLLGVSAILVIAARIHFLEIPLDRDEGAYGYLGWMALAGETPYVGFYEMKPPLLFYTYAVIIALFGKSATGLHLAALLLNGIGVYFLYRLSKRIWGPIGGVVTAIGCLFLAMNIHASGFSMQSEHIVLAFAAPGLYLTLKGSQNRHLRTVFWGGFLLACAALVKQNAIFYCAAGALMAGLNVFPLRGWKRMDLLKWLGCFVAGALIPVVVTLLVLLIIGSLDEFWYWIYEHPTKYVSTRSWADGVNPLIYYWQHLAEGHQVWIGLTAIGALLTPFVPRVGWREKVWVLAFFVLSGLTIIPGMRFYGHYWLLFFPGWMLIAPALFTGMSRWFEGQNPRLKWLPALLLAGVIAWHTTAQWDRYYQSDLDEVVREVYPGNFFVEHKQLSEWLEPQMSDDDQLIVMGSEPQVYLYTKKKSPTRHFYMTFTSKPIPEAEQWEQQTIGAIKRSKPEYVVFNFEPYSWMFKDDSKRKLYNWMYRHTKTYYTPIACIELNKHADGVWITGAQAANYTPRTTSYIIISKRNPE